MMALNQPPTYDQMELYTGVGNRETYRICLYSIIIAILKKLGNLGEIMDFVYRYCEWVCCILGTSCFCS
jgi:hypothetical protein